MSTRHGLLGRLGALPTALLVGVVHVYQAVSAVTPGACRFEPTCSSYALTALRRHGALRGSWLALGRIARCHPLGGWGYDPVPDARLPDARLPDAAALDPEPTGRVHLKETT